MMKIVAASSLAFALSGPAIAHAAGGVPLLDLTLHGQLERWLGAGPLQLDNIYTRQAGDDSLDFHAAADNKGDTFTLLRLTTPEGASYLVGGYNPQSWSSTDGWHVTERDPERTAFIFNYTAPAVYRQVPTTYILPSQGARQTFNAPDHGPTFGAGPDLFVGRRLDTAISWQVSYGNPADQGKSIVDRSLGGRFMHIDAMELYAVSVIPEPAAAGMLAAGLGLLALAGRRRPVRSAVPAAG